MKRRKAPDNADQVETLIAEAKALPHGATQVELCEEAVRLADLHGDQLLAYDAREALVEAACFGGRPDLLIIAFSWCLATFDKNQGGWISTYDLLWRMKWVVTALASFPTIELTTIHKMLDDMERRYVEFGNSVQPVLDCRRTVALQTGNLAAAKEINKKLVRMPRTYLSDCQACELNSQADYYFSIYQNAVGIRKAEHLLVSGMRCSRVPDATYSAMLLPLLKLGRGRDAMAFHKKGYPLVRRSVSEMTEWGEHMMFLGLTGNEDRAVKIFERHMPAVESSHDPRAKLSFLRQSIPGLDALAARREKAKLRLPAESPHAKADGQYVVADLADAMYARCLEISSQFDRRNGNTYYVDLLNKTRKLQVVPVPYGD